jgi:hypothetical protein
LNKQDLIKSNFTHIYRIAGLQYIIPSPSAGVTFLKYTSVGNTKAYWELGVTGTSADVTTYQSSSALPVSSITKIIVRNNVF